MGLEQLGAEAGQPGDLIGLAVGLDVDVEVNAVLGRLPFGHPLEEQPGLGAARVTAGGDVPESRAAVDDDAVPYGHAAGRDELVD